MGADASVVFDIVTNDKSSSKMDGIKKSAGLLAAGVGLMAVKFGKDSVEAFKESERSQLELQNAFAKFPALSDTNVGKLQALNSELAKKTTFDDDATASGQAVLAQFKLTGQQISELTPLMQDYAAKTGKDLPAAAEILGKAMLGKGKALSAVGIQFKDAGSASANYEQVMAGLRTQVGGFAEKEGKTAAGQAQILGNQFGEVQETVGSKLTPVLTKFTGILLTSVDFISRNSNVIIPLVAVLGTLGAVVYTVITAQKVWTATQAAFNVVMSANPIVLVGIAVAALVAGIVIAYQRSETFREIVDKAFAGVRAAGELLWSALKTVFGFVQGAFETAGKAGDAMWGVLQKAFGFVVKGFLAVADAILGGATKAFGWVPGLGDKLKDAKKDFEKFRADVNAQLDGIHDKTVTINWKQNVLALDAHDVARLANQRGLPGRAAGGDVFAGRAYIVGEHRPEVFVPTQNGTIIPSLSAASAARGGGGSTFISLTVNAAVGSNAASIGAELVQFLMAYERTTGRQVLVSST